VGLEWLDFNKRDVGFSSSSQVWVNCARAGKLTNESDRIDDASDEEE